MELIPRHVICCQYVARIDIKKPQCLVYNDITVSVGGPTCPLRRVVYAL